jgi:hypothetical protein
MVKIFRANQLSASTFKRLMLLILSIQVGPHGYSRTKTYQGSALIHIMIHNQLLFGTAKVFREAAELQYFSYAYPPIAKTFQMTLFGAALSRLTWASELSNERHAEIEAQSSGGQGAEGTTTPMARCDVLKTSEPELAPLEQTCNFALESANILPNFICQEKSEHFVSNLKQQKWKPTDVVKAEVTFEQGTETYSNVLVNDRPLELPRDARSGPALSQYLISHGQRGVWDLIEFGTNLRMLFREESQTSFKSRGKGSIAGIRTTQFDFDINLSHSPFQFFWARSNSRQGGSVKAHVVPYGVQGSLWLLATNQSLFRIQIHATDLPKNSPISSSTRVTNYGMVSIGEAGQFLLPVGSEGTNCSNRERRCDRDVLEFTSCRKFGTESRILQK